MRDNYVSKNFHQNHLGCSKTEKDKTGSETEMRLQGVDQGMTCS